MGTAATLTLQLQLPAWKSASKPQPQGPLSSRRISHFLTAVRLVASFRRTLCLQSCDQVHDQSLHFHERVLASSRTKLHDRGDARGELNECGKVLLLARRLSNITTSNPLRSVVVRQPYLRPPETVSTSVPPLHQFRIEAPGSLPPLPSTPSRRLPRKPRDLTQLLVLAAWDASTAVCKICLLSGQGCAELPPVRLRLLQSLVVLRQLVLERLPQQSKVVRSVRLSVASRPTESEPCPANR